MMLCFPIAAPQDKVPLKLIAIRTPIGWISTHRESRNQEPERNVGVAPLSHSYARLQWGNSANENVANTSLDSQELSNFWYNDNHS